MEQYDDRPVEGLEREAYKAGAIPLFRISAWPSRPRSLLNNARERTRSLLNNARERTRSLVLTLAICNKKKIRSGATNTGTESRYLKSNHTT